MLLTTYICCVIILFRCLIKEKKLDTNKVKVNKLPRHVYLVIDVDTREVQSAHPSRNEARECKRQFQQEGGAGYTILQYALQAQVR